MVKGSGRKNGHNQMICLDLGIKTEELTARKPFRHIIDRNQERTDYLDQNQNRNTQNGLFWLIPKAATGGSSAAIMGGLDLPSPPG